MLFDDFVRALKLADKVFVAPIYINKEKPDGSLSNQTLADAVNKFKPAKAVNGPEELKKYLDNIKTNKPLCVAMLGAGKIYEWTKKILHD